MDTEIRHGGVQHGEIERSAVDRKIPAKLYRTIVGPKTSTVVWGGDIWAAVFTFNPYLLISINEIIDINNSFIDINKYGHSIHLY